MADLKGTKTEENLKTALAGESQARVKYEFYASQAKKDGYVEIKEIFQESSDNEKEHAKVWFKLLNGGKVPPTTDNLADAVKAAYEVAQKGDTVLLSPCCASFDLFKNYEDRGEQFKEAVKKL